MSYYDPACRMSKRRHRLKYGCSLPMGKGHPPKKYHTEAQRKKGERNRKRILRDAKKREKEEALRVAGQMEQSGKL